MKKNTYGSFEEYFEKATGNKPYPYQKKLATSETPDVLNVPTGAGKTEAAILGLWLWKRLNGNAPRKLVYCLPMRVLVEQTKARVELWLKKLGLDNRIGVELLMGGSDVEIQKLLPDKEYIIVGTQDMLVSGALNRAYGNSPTNWPIIFGFLNNDCMWIMDEVQIMENALPTAIQLARMRDEFKTYGAHKTVLMSATINQDWLETVDSPRDSLSIYNFDMKKDSNESLEKRNKAQKTLFKAPITLQRRYGKEEASKILKLHKPGTPTAVIVNTVERAQYLYETLSKMTNTECKLMHSRFRAHERKALNEYVSKLGENDDVIIIATQVLEAGIDVSFQTLVTELAPWSSMVQRFGRCNRRGNLNDAKAYWINLDQKYHAPYGTSENAYSEKQLEKLEKKSISPHALPNVNEQKFFDAILRKRDILNLFDTASDLSGNHTDVSKFVRSMEQQLNVDVFWRENADEGKSFHRVVRDEICSVKIDSLKGFLQKKNSHGYIWDHVDGRWKKIRPSEMLQGHTIMLDSKNAAGYSDEYGWYPDNNDEVKMIGTIQQDQSPDSYDADPTSKSVRPVTLEAHTGHVIRETNKLTKNIIEIDGDTRKMLQIAATYHDIGKVHCIFQGTMRNGLVGEYDQKTVWAKSQKNTKHKIRGFRHEAVSALAYLEQKDQTKYELRDLVAYLIMAHHGKVRMSLRRFSRKNQDGGKYLLGIKTDGDYLPEFSCKYVNISKSRIDTGIGDMGREEDRPSWVERTLTLLEQYGPFRLAYLEALIRRSDWLASEKETAGEYK
ncbi:MAG: CRISPR-associated helicase Cas3' [Gammaproteobacteria bacterium]|nr:CRISPR-associated helicase Cas3' [Gammaproteobacteria bacterium]